MDKKKVCTCSVQMHFFQNIFDPQLVEFTNTEATHIEGQLLCSDAKRKPERVHTNVSSGFFVYYKIRFVCICVCVCILSFDFLIFIF